MAPSFVILSEDASLRGSALRKAFNDPRYFVKTGTFWHMLKNDLPPWPVVYYALYDLRPRRTRMRRHQPVRCHAVTEPAESANPTEPQPYNLSINTMCDLPPASLEGFCRLLQELLPLARIPHVEHLGGILLIGDGQMGDTVNTVAGQGDQSDLCAYTPSATWRATATAVPVVRDGRLACVVLLEESLVRSLTPDNYRVYPTNSSLLEELLHVRVYSGLWAHLQEGDDSLPELRLGEGPLAACMNALGEYLANRWKANLLSTLPLTAVEGGYAPVTVQYPDALGPLLDDAGERIMDLVLAVASGAKPFKEGWQELLQIVYRGVLEPLARECACRDGNTLGDVPIHEPDVEQSRFYQRCVAPYADEWRQALRRAADAFDTNPREAVAALIAMRETLNRFLSRVGVEYKPRPNAQSHVMFYGWTALTLRHEIAASA